MLETLSASRKSVKMSSTAGNELNSSGFAVYSATSRITSEIAMLVASKRSSMNAGSGRISSAMMKTTATARPTSALRFISESTGAGSASRALMQRASRVGSGSPRRRITKASTSATATYSSAGIGMPTRLLASSARASGRFSTIGTPASAAIALIRWATLRWPIASTTGASAFDGSYFSAIAMWVGLVMTTSAFGTSPIIWLAGESAAHAAHALP